MPNLNKMTVDAFQFYLDEYFPFNIYKSGDNFSIASKSARPNTATGLTSFAIGTDTVASEQFSVAMGAHTQATASAAVALGAFCQASGGNSFAMGNTSKAQNNCAIALGKEIQAKGQYQTAVGAFNDFSNTEAKFVVGAGSSNNDRKNAFTTGIDSKGAYITIGNDKKFYASSILTAETDPTVPAWAKAPNPPACPVKSVNKKTGDVVLNLADLSTDANHRVVTDTEKQTWNSKSNFSGSYNDLTNKPTLFSGSYNDLTNKPNLFDGNYNSLSNKPVFTNVSLNWGETKTFVTIGETKYTISIPTLNVDPEGESIGMATPTTLGIVKSAQNRNISPSLITGGATANRYYGVELDADGTMFVNVPWVEGTSSSVTVINKGATLGWGKDNTIATINGTDITLKMPQNPDTDTNYYHTPLFNSGLQITTGTGVNNAYIPYAGASQYGVVKPKAIRNASIAAVTGQTATNRYYGVELDSNGQMFVNVPWTGGASGSSDLPAVSTSDNGKFLRVENGTWQAVQVSVYNGEVL